MSTQTIIPTADAKAYLRVDFDDDDDLIDVFLLSAENLVSDTLRRELTNDDKADQVIRIAILFAVAYLYEHRDDANMSELTKNLRYILSTKRNIAF